MARQPLVFPSRQSLIDPAVLSRLLECRIDHVELRPLTTVGYSSAAIQRLIAHTHDGRQQSLIFKTTALTADWTARLTGDADGREALLLGTESLSPVWDVFECPYIAAASEAGAIALLMTDLTSALFPDVREPLTDAQEGALLGALARMHARFWEFTPPGSWLMGPAQYCDLLPPSIADSPASLAHLTSQLRDVVPRGWAAALARLPSRATHLVTRPGVELVESWTDLPRTLLHGDVKVANFALLPGGRVSAFDWALAGAGPCTIDIGWYIAVNASRLTRSKEDLLLRYRSLLESALHQRLADSLWSRLEEVAIIASARMLLWSKALALEMQRPGADEEWRWWSDRITVLAGRRANTP